MEQTKSFARAHVENRLTRISESGEEFDRWLNEIGGVAIVSYEVLANDLVDLAGGSVGTGRHNPSRPEILAELSQEKFDWCGEILNSVEKAAIRWPEIAKRHEATLVNVRRVLK